VFSVYTAGLAQETLTTQSLGSVVFRLACCSGQCRE